MLHKTLESPLDYREIQPVHPEGNQSWIFIGRMDAEAKTPILWPPDSKKWLIWKDPDRERLKARGEGDNRGWDGWMASQTQGTWFWVYSGSWWWTGRPGVLRFMSCIESDTTEWLNRITEEAENHRNLLLSNFISCLSSAGSCWLDLIEVSPTVSPVPVNRLLQHHSSKASLL